MDAHLVQVKNRLVIHRIVTLQMFLGYWQKQTNSSKECTDFSIKRASLHSQAEESLCLLYVFICLVTYLILVSAM